MSPALRGLSIKTGSRRYADPKHLETENGHGALLPEPTCRWNSQVFALWTYNDLHQKRAASLFAQAGRCHAKHGDDGKNDSASTDLDGDVAAQLPERIARPPLAGVGSKRRCEPKPIDRREPQHDKEQRDLDQQEMAVVSFGQCPNAARQIPSIDCASEEERADRDDPISGKAQAHRARNRE